MEGMTKEQKELQQELEKWKGQERDYQERINEDAKDLEKMTSKQSTLLKKVRIVKFKFIKFKQTQTQRSSSCFVYKEIWTDMLVLKIILIHTMTMLPSSFVYPFWRWYK